MPTTSQCARRDPAHSAQGGIVQKRVLAAADVAARETTMRGLLVLLVALTMACAAAASVTIAQAPAHADDVAKGY